MQALKGVLLDVADKAGENVANTLIKLLRHRSRSICTSKRLLSTIPRTLAPRALRAFAALPNPTNASFQKQAKGMFTMIPSLS
jgi:hypothetical protein